MELDTKALIVCMETSAVTIVSPLVVSLVLVIDYGLKLV